jgi:hypothetical protein
MASNRSIAASTASLTPLSLKNGDQTARGEHPPECVEQIRLGRFWRIPEFGELALVGQSGDIVNRPPECDYRQAASQGQTTDGAVDRYHGPAARYDLVEMPPSTTINRSAIRSSVRYDRSQSAALRNTDRRSMERPAVTEQDDVADCLIDDQPFKEARPFLLAGAKIDRSRKPPKRAITAVEIARCTRWPRASSACPKRSKNRALRRAPVP